ncbi:MAG: TonB-dependent receptor plug domain-containing protein, partial [Alphaproteobacteria bacterium]|nr:TonB-dependent receptor plug domain-containing protein [Alphaproteobacteria bacterium]
MNVSGYLRAVGIAGVAIFATTMAASAQDAAPEPEAPAAATPEAPAAATDGAQLPDEAQLPDIDIIQDTPQQRRKKKKQVAISPLSTAAPTATAATVAGTAGAGETGSDSAEDAGVDAATQASTVPSAVSTITPSDITREGSKQVQNAIEQNVPSATLSDAAGNPARAELQFRGFDASPVNGRSQGLAVYQNGIRINEAFGDTVNWSFIPTNAIESVSIISNNPAFGLNALGGAASIVMRDGFSFQGAEFDIMAGSFGRIQTGAQAGMTNGNAAVYAALEGIWEDGFRDFSDTEVRRMFADVGLRGSMAEVHLSVTAASNEFGATAAAPVELLDRRYANTFTSPQTNDLEMIMPTISGTVKANQTLTLSGAAYYRYFKSNVVDGNVTEAEPCDAVNGGPTFLCVDEGGGLEPVNDQFGNPLFIGDIADDRLGSIERLNTESRSWGAAFELKETTPLFGMDNQFVLGASYDRGTSNYT